MPIPLGILAVAGAGAGGGSYELIQTYSATGSSGVITFSSIPQTYKHLQIRAVNKLNTSDTDTVNVSKLSINGNDSNFSVHGVSADGGINNLSSNGYPYIWSLPTNNNGADSFAAQVIDIYDYASTVKNTTIRMLNGHCSDTTRNIVFHNYAYLSTTEVTSITLTGGSGYNWKSGSRFSLYGLKG